MSLVIGLCLAAPAAHAEFKLRYPSVEYRELELEHNGDTTFDKAKSGKSNNQSYTYEIEYGVTSFLRLGLEGDSAAPSTRPCSSPGSRGCASTRRWNRASSCSAISRTSRRPAGSPSSSIASGRCSPAPTASRAPYGDVKYELGYLLSLTRATEQGAVRWRLEYEIPF